MRVGMVRLALAAAVAAGGTARGSDPQLPPLPAPTIGGGPPTHSPPIVSRPIMSPPSLAPEMPLPVMLSESDSGLGYSHHHHHHEGHEEGHCIPGVYKTEISRFPGNGYVARKHPYTIDQNTMERAGFPKEISHLAVPSDGPHYTGYFVGGGASLFHKGGRNHPLQEGTWGWDYEHLGLKRRVQLLFSKGRLYQDGDGQYEPDPPFEITNVFAIRYGERLHRFLGHEAE
ncbi:hypothetical protein [Tautonia sociabilis]|uniref:Uncharacterized protein n=1 Tax=Tautonia sociabilis TaxID=2080755 RepID=A0A432MLS8_9BACT|nr:hypothetical protein [Tautonia sociabilis]RUL88361.1 hypothetical protein TsocGM_07500 [Tautonia sociabilis]